MLPGIYIYPITGMVCWTLKRDVVRLSEILSISDPWSIWEVGLGGEKGRRKRGEEQVRRMRRKRKRRPPMSHSMS